MKILLLTQVLPYPPDSGPKIKTWNVIKYLTLFHRVTLVSFVRGDQSKAIRHLEACCEAVHTTPIERGFLHDVWAMFLSFLMRKPFLMVRDDRKKMRRLVDSISGKTRYDLICADQLNMGQYALRVSYGTKIMDTHNALWLLYKRLWETMNGGLRKWLLGREWRLLKVYEGTMCQSFDGVLSVSVEDKKALEEAIGEPWDIKVIPITIDKDEFPFIKREKSPNHILHLGTMYWPPNVDGVLWFLREVWPRIRAQRLDIKLDLVGTRPPNEIVSLANSENGVNLTDYVEDLNPYLRQAALIVIPLRVGSGMRVRILTAMAHGIPIVSTTIGCEGIHVEHEKNILIADTPGKFAAAVLRLIGDREFANMIGQNGRRHVEEVYDYRVVLEQLEDAYRNHER